mmetsp:Transcript_17961/g.30208  ORF Transcript_17961/g.30208 Transcript_17961/m.30208 type:complete len:235 (+) Transcript_17961:3176-3880(+)
MRHALFYVHLQDFLLLDNLVPPALLALVLLGDHLARSSALGADGLHLLDHARAYLANCYLHTRTLAARAAPSVARLGSLALALGADHILRKRKLLRGAPVHILHGDLQRMRHVLALATTSGATAATPHTAATTEKGLENVERVPSAAAATATHAFLQRVLTVLIVDLALLGILQHLVRLADLLELLLISTLVGVVLDGHLAVGLLDLILSGIFFYRESGVVFGVVGFLAWSEHI